MRQNSYSFDNSDYTTSNRIKHVNRTKHMARINMSYKQILEHLERIDKYLQMPYKEFDITPYLGKSIDDIAYAMMMHVGLYDYRPVIEYDRLDGKTGGYIELNNNPDKKVRITLSDDLSISKESKYETLAHEICHKLLYTRGCYFPDMGDYNEALTDLTTIYAGFGKLTLNGCIVINATGSMYTGYLDLAHYAMAYRMVCHINHIPKEEYEAGLDAEALPVIQHDPMVAHIEQQLSDPLEALQQYRLRTYAADAAMMREVVLLEAALAKIKAEIMSNQKADIETTGVVDAKNGEIINPYRVLLMTMDADQIKPDQPTPEGDSVYRRLKKMLSDNRIQDATLNISCPICGYSKEKALKEHKKTLIRCPKCNRVFYWDASLETKLPLKKRLAALFHLNK